VSFREIVLVYAVEAQPSPLPTLSALYHPLLCRACLVSKGGSWQIKQDTNICNE
jgi:hypothetical protein